MSLPTPGETVSAIVRALTDPERVPGTSEHSLILDRRPGDAAALILERDEQVRADERARVSVVHSTLTDEQLLDELVRRGVLREEVVPAFHGLGFTEPAVHRHVTAGDELPPDPLPTPEEIEALRRRLTGEGATS